MEITSQIEYNKSVDEFKRAKIKAAYKKLTTRQQAFFNRLWKSVDTVPNDSSLTAINQCERTIIKNNQ